MLLLLADENIPIPSYIFLKQKRYDIKHVAFEQAGIKDREVISIAILEDRIIVTFDSDFGELVFRLGFRPVGVIYFRWKDFLPAEPGEYLHQIIKENQITLKGYFTVIDEDRIRQRKI